MAIVTTDNKHYADIADKIREKINSEEKLRPEKMAAAVDTVYAAGQKSIADAIPTIPTTVSTNKTYLRIDDISEVPHDVTIFNPRYYDAVYVCGKNLLNEEEFHNKDKWVATVKDNGSIDYNYYFSLPEGTYTFSAISNITDTAYLYLYKYSGDGETAEHVGNVLSGAGATPITVNVGIGDTLRFFIYPFKKLIGSTETLKVQVEWGSTATTYEPYKGQYVETPWDDEKQMHIGVAKSIYPTMTIDGYYDDHGVHVTYNKSCGKQAAYDTFWDAYQQNGKRKQYRHAFGGTGWTNITFKPKYNMQPTNAYMMFYDSQMTGDLDEILSAQGVTLDFSNCTDMCYLFYLTGLNTIGTIDCSKCTIDLPSLFNSVNIVTIRNFIPPNVAMKNTWFQSGLTNLKIGGEISANANFSRCINLTYESLMSIIKNLKDYSSSGTTYTLTLGADNLAKLTDAEKAIATQKGWTLG